MISGASSTGNVGQSRQTVDMSPRRKKVKKEKQRKPKKVMTFKDYNFKI